jgi:4a-hydroxytetrahydrobiopterin dehydratase
MPQRSQITIQVNSARLTRKRIISCVLFNLLGTPGMGSVIARRWFAGIGQIILSLAGFVLVLIWFYRLVIVQFYGQINGPVTPQPVGWIGLLGAILFALAWFWSLGTSISLLREASRVRVQSLKSFAAGQMKLDEVKIGPALAAVPQWKRNGDLIVRTFQFKDFPAAIKFVEAVAVIAEEAQHHPDIDIRWNKVTLALTTHDAGGLTEKDFALAQQFDQL